MRQQLDHLRDQMQQTGAYVQAACGRHAVVAQARRLANATTCSCDKTADAYGTGECPPPPSRGRRPNHLCLAKTIAALL
jgi:hypothetical protein